MEYNKHYIRIDASCRVVDGWSDGIRPFEDLTSAICINEEGGHQFRLFGEENPPLFNGYMIPLYKWENEKVAHRSEEEIAADVAAIPEEQPPQESGEASVWDELDAAYQEGVDSV